MIICIQENYQSRNRLRKQGNYRNLIQVEFPLDFHVILCLACLVEAIDAILFLSGRTTTGSDSTRTVPRDSLSDNEREHDKRNDSHNIPTDIFPRLVRALEICQVIIPH